MKSKHWPRSQSSDDVLQPALGIPNDFRNCFNATHPREETACNFDRNGTRRSIVTFRHSARVSGTVGEETRIRDSPQRTRTLRFFCQLHESLSFSMCLRIMRCFLCDLKGILKHLAHVFLRRYCPFEYLRPIQFFRSDISICDRSLNISSCFDPVNVSPARYNFDSSCINGKKVKLLGP
jgi:hypothetical protein